MVMPASDSRKTRAITARTVRFPKRLRELIAADAERCGRSFEAQVIAILRHNYGEDVDIAPAPEAILRLARASFQGLSPEERRLVTQRFVEPGES